MTTLLLLMAQAAALDVPPPPEPRNYAVSIPTHVRRPCEVSPDPDVITICGKPHDDQFRLKPIPLPRGMKPPRDGPGIDFDIGKVQGNAYTTS